MLAALLLAGFTFNGSTSEAQQHDRQLDRYPVTSSTQTTRRTALVIGNAAYTVVPQLKNPTNDAALVAGTLKNLGFEVSVGTNKSQREMKQLIRDFGQRLREGGGVGLFYFAGHGAQSNGNNYLIPVDADVQNEADLEDMGVDVNYVLSIMAVAKSSLNIVILDACRNNPFTRSFRSAQGGLAHVDAPSGTVIAYATAANSTAADGDSANSPYTEELTKQMEAPGVVLETMFRRVTEKVSARTGGRQEPWTSDNHKGEFYFKRATSSPAGISQNEPVKIDPVAVEREYWEAIRNSKDAQDFKNYLKTYPNGVYAAIAQTKSKQLEATTTKPQSNLAGSNTAEAPTNAGSQTFRIEGFRLVATPEVSMLLPTESITESRRSLYNGGYVSRTVYRTPIGQRPFFAVITAGGINARGSRPSDAEKLDSYVDAFKYWLPEAVFGRGEAARLTLIGEKTLGRTPGREYRVTVGDSSGTARAYFNGSRFFVAVALEASAEQAKQFFDSFASR